MKKVSVIIPCYNVAKWLPKCFLSLVSQTIGIAEMELIFVDDASTDNGATWELMQEFEKAYPQNVMVIHLDTNMRQGGARNAALEYATGEYVAFVDADDFVTDDFLEKAYGRAKETDADIVQFEYYYYKDRVGVMSAGKGVRDEIIVVDSVESRRRLLMEEKLTYGCWNKLYRRELVLRAGVGYAEHVVYEEPLFVYPLLFYGKKYVIMSDELYVYRQNASGTMYSDMENMQTLHMHMQVQLAVWNFMKQTEFFKLFYEEIKLYFLHTYFYETLYFAKKRGFRVSMELYAELENTVKVEVDDYARSSYEAVIPRQMELYRLAKSGMSKEQLEDFMQRL